MSSSKHHPCPICSKPVPHWDRYPRAVCEVCFNKACDVYGQKLNFYNVSISGGFKAVFAETQEEYQSHICYIDGVECRADEARFGGIVIEALSEPIKFYHLNTPHEEDIRQAITAREAAEMGRDRRRLLRQDWEVVKDDVMREALYAKFTQHPELTEKLLSTGDLKLIEHTTNDRYWADGGDGTGLNMLGQLLMETRQRIRHNFLPKK